MSSTQEFSARAMQNLANVSNNGLLDQLIERIIVNINEAADAGKYEYEVTRTNFDERPIMGWGNKFNSLITQANSRGTKQIEWYREADEIKFVSFFTEKGFKVGYEGVSNINTSGGVGPVFRRLVIRW